jgi:uncharacterized lipoprotein YddW (UPF0748 family)
MIRVGGIILFCFLPFALQPATGAGAYVQSSLKPPAIPREFRAVWIATVGNINWPSKPGLSVSDQKAELLRLLDRAAELRLNAIIFQVRPACDALYASPFEPWSEYLSGKMGQAPSPSYDPLAFAVAEAHNRGLELHAWFNPFRARYFKAISPISSGHISRTQPQLVKKYGQFLWLDPGEPAVQDHSLKVILDVVRRYDVDGVHMDDYYYPYPEKDRAGNALDFPDDTSWRRYLASGGKLNRSDWRRENVNNFVQRLYALVKKEKPFVKVGMSPFGIWRPGFPPQIRGFDAYEKLYADSRKWLMEGWVDYFSPQLYWSIDAREQSFPVLHKWWTEQNPKSRHIWPGLSIHGTDGKRTAAEVKNQIVAARQQPGTDGTIFWGVRGLMENRNRVADVLKSEVYTEPALIPAFPWLDAQRPATPILSANENAKGWKIGWTAEATDKPRLWVLQTRRKGVWRTEILPANHAGRMWNVNDEPEAIAVSSVDRCNNVSTPAILAKQAGQPSS